MSRARLLLKSVFLMLTAAAALQSRTVSRPARAGDTDVVGQWDRFELSISSPNSYGDPYRDVALYASYARPDQTQVRLRGFYDGGATWKIRFMPDKIGTWKYHAWFSDGSGEVRGKFECIASDLPGMLKADETNPLWFGFQGGGHVLIRSFHVGDRFFASNWPAAKRTAFLDWAQAQGYNMLSIASHYLNRPRKTRGLGWDTPDLWDRTGARPRPAEYRKMEAILDELSRRRILIYPFAGFCGQASDFPKAADDQELFVRYTLARIGSYWNLTFNAAGPDPQSRGSDFLNRLGGIIKANDAYGHPLSIHNCQLFDFPWVSYVVLQGAKTVDLKSVYDTIRRRHDNMPLYAQEVFWPGNYLHKQLVTNAQIRKKAYVLCMAAAAINFGDMGDGRSLGSGYHYGNSSSGFSGSMDLKDRHQEWHDIVKQVWDFFETVPFYRMKPHPELVDNGYCLAEVGREYLTYLETSGAVNVKTTGGPFEVEWINARRPSDRRPGPATSDGRRLTSPEGGDDWLLILRRAEAFEELERPSG